MRTKLSLTFHLTMAVWITIVWSLCLWRVSMAAPDCTLNDDAGDILKCKVTTNSDFGNLSTVAENIFLEFTEGNTVSLEDSLFPYLPALRTLTVDLRHISDLSSGAFKLLSNLENLQFDNTDIYRPLLPFSLKSGTLAGLITLKTLNITEIGLTQVETGAFEDLTNLTHLVIGSNKIQSLPDSVFSATKLESLIVSYVELSQLSSSIFQGLQNLKVFQFSHSKIQTLEPSLFSDMSNLEEINLENNELLSLSTETFKGLNNLKELQLKNNKNLTTLQYGIFSDLTNLITLDICFCGLEVVEDRVFENLGLLKYLKLTNNMIPAITSNTLRGLTSLSSLDFENNAITSIPANAFSESPNIVILHLYNNEINDIDQQAFDGTDLSVVTLNGNKLTTLPEGAFNSFTNMNHIDLSNNPWECTCSITWLKTWLEQQAPTVLDNSDTTTCSSPADQRGEVLKAYVEQAYSGCLPTTTTLPAPSTTTTTTTTTAATTTAAFNDTTLGVVTSVNEEKNTGIEKGTVIGIVVACILVALLIIIVVIIAMCCRHRKYAFWAPPQTDKPDGKRPASDLKYLARHQVGSFYQDPDTYSVSAMWETESTKNDPRYSIDPDVKRDSMKNRYVYENPALDATDPNDNSVVVVDTNSTTVRELPLSAAALPVNGQLHGSNESMPYQRNDASPLPAHGYHQEPSDHSAVPIPDYDEVDGDLEVQPEQYQINPEQYQMRNLARPGNYSPGSESPRANSISSISDVAPDDIQPQVQDQPELQAVIDPPRAALSLNTDRSSPPLDDYEHLHAEPTTPSSVHDYIPLEYQPDKPDSGLKVNVNAYDPGDYEHLHEPASPSSPHDYVGLQPEGVVVPIPEQHDFQARTSSTDAHGGTAAYNNAYLDE